jgi:RNA polymerase-binding protein DksA
MVPRALAKSTVDRFHKRLIQERDRLSGIIREIDEEREEIRLSETSSDRSPDPNTAEGGSLAFELEKEFSLAFNAQDLLAKVVTALEKIEDGTYGMCTDCGKSIPVARLDALPSATVCVDCACPR